MNNYTDYLQHHGIKGQKWGIRRFQNPDGTLTSKGKIRDKSSNKKKMSQKTKRGLKTAAAAGALAVGGVALGMYLHKNAKDISAMRAERGKIYARTILDSFNASMDNLDMISGWSGFSTRGFTPRVHLVDD